MQNLISIGIIVIFIGILLVVIGSLISGKGESKWAVGGFIGPIPFGIFNDARMMWAVAGISIILLIFFLLPILKGLI